MCAETVGPAVALFSGMLLSSSPSSISSSSSSTVAFISLWFLVWLVLVIMVLLLVCWLFLVGSMVVGLVMGGGRLLICNRGWLMVRGRGGCECWVSLVLASWMFLSGLMRVVLLVLQVVYLIGKVLEQVLYVGIF